jgi:hypothetical protein
VTAVRRQHEGGISMTVATIDIRAGLQQLSNALNVTVGGGIFPR